MNNILFAKINKKTLSFFHFPHFFVTDNCFQQFLRWAFEPGREYRFTLRDPRGFQREVCWVRISQ